MPLPNHLYKYRAINDHTFAVITEHELFFPNVELLDDPFDCRPRLSFNCTESDFVALADKNHLGLRSILESRYPGQALGESARLLYPQRESLIPPEANKAFEAFVADTGIFCLSEAPDSVLLWSHYADNHRGVCLEFDTQADGLFSHARKVAYGSDLPIFECFNANRALLAERSLFRKSSDWAYQAEWRIIGTRKARTKQCFNPASLSAVILGARISSPDASKIAALCAQLPRRPRVLKAMLKSDSFGVEILVEAGL